MLRIAKIAAKEGFHLFRVPMVGDEE